MAAPQERGREGKRSMWRYAMFLFIIFLTGCPGEENGEKKGALTPKKNQVAVLDLTRENCSDTVTTLVVTLSDGVLRARGQSVIFTDIDGKFSAEIITCLGDQVLVDVMLFDGAERVELAPQGDFAYMTQNDNGLRPMDTGDFDVTVIDGRATFNFCVMWPNKAD